jgi:DUF3011 family protein
MAKLGRKSDQAAISRGAAYSMETAMNNNSLDRPDPSVPVVIAKKSMDKSMMIALLVLLLGSMAILTSLVTPAFADDDDDKGKYSKSEKYPGKRSDDKAKNSRDSRNSRDNRRYDDRNDDDRNYRDRNYDNRNYDGRNYDNRRGQRIIRCNSNDYRYEFCRAGGRIERAWIANQLSLADCTLGYTWGYSRDGVWTKNGCRAEFGVSYNSRARGLTGYDTPRQNYADGRRYGSDPYYDNDRYYGYGGRDYGDDHRYNSRTGRRAAVDRCFYEIESKLRYQGYRSVRLVRIAQVKRHDGIWRVRLEVAASNSRRGYDSNWRRSNYDDEHHDRGRRNYSRNSRGGKVKCKVSRNGVRVTDFDWFH